MHVSNALLVGCLMPGWKGISVRMKSAWFAWGSWGSWGYDGSPWVLPDVDQALI